MIVIVPGSFGGGAFLKNLGGAVLRKGGGPF
jgi:hypothetical protein